MNTNEIIIDDLKYQTYDEYIDSKIEWLGKIPNHFKKTNIKNVIKNTIGGDWGEEPKNDNISTNVIRVNDFDRNCSLVKNNELTQRIISTNSLNARKIAKGNLLLEKSGGGEKTPVGQVVLFNKNYIAITSNFILLIRLNKNVIPWFVNHYFKLLYNKRVNILSIKETTGIQNINQNDYFKNEFYLPSKEEQLTIVKFLNKKIDTIDKKISILERRRTLINELEQSIINQCVTKGVDSFTKLDSNGNLIDFDNKLNRNKEDFDLYMNENGYKNSEIEWLGYVPNHYEIKRIKNEFNVYTGNSIKDEKREFYINNNNGLNFIATKDISNFEINYDSEIKIPKEHNFKKLDKYTPLLCIEGGSAGKKMAITNKEIHFGNKLCSFNNKSILLKKYFYYYLQSYPFQLQFNNELSGMIEGVSIGIIKRLYNILPSKKEQLTIVKFLDNKTKQFKLQKDKINKEIELLEEYKKTLINDVVTGKIKVTKD